jgi:hypothetical protein
MIRTASNDVEAVAPAAVASSLANEPKLDKESELYADDDDDVDSLDNWAPEKQAAYWESACLLTCM